MARCSFETANFFFLVTWMETPIVNNNVHASAPSISYGEQNSTIAHQAIEVQNSSVELPARCTSSG
jgi:hypothetical protein